MKPIVKTLYPNEIVEIRSLHYKDGCLAEMNVLILEITSHIGFHFSRSVKTQFSGIYPLYFGKVQTKCNIYLEIVTLFTIRPVKQKKLAFLQI